MIGFVCIGIFEEKEIVKVEENPNLEFKFTSFCTNGMSFNPGIGNSISKEAPFKIKNEAEGTEYTLKYEGNKLDLEGSDGGHYIFSISACKRFVPFISINNK